VTFVTSRAPKCEQRFTAGERSCGREAGGTLRTERINRPTSRSVQSPVIICRARHVVVALSQVPRLLRGKAILYPDA
jgi:hypothetical protein